MVNLVIAYDDNDSSLADYFESSYQYVSDLIAPIDSITHHPIPGLNCTELHIADTINAFNGQRFCFVGFSHGNSDMLLTDNDVYISGNNCALFNQSVFYSLGCQTAVTLGTELINNGCSTFVGYYDDSYVTYEQFNDVYISCENFALKEFLTTDISLGDAFDLMMDNYDLEIQKMVDANEILMAMELTHNKDCTGILGNEDIKLEDLHF
jgi:hypothetical protein